MKRTLSLLSACFITLVVLMSAVKDDDWLSALLAKLDKYRADYPQEKVHLQLDKPYYSIGDDLWFKAYVVNSEKNELSALSKVLYVDLVDIQDTVTKTIVVPIANGLANGDVKITDSLFNTGTYHVRAYTRWMQNFKSDFIFSRDIFIGDARTPTGVIADGKFNLDQTKLTGQITYVNLGDKTPLAAKPVTYTLYYNNKPIAKGKGTTDAEGKININEDVKAEQSAIGVYMQTTITVAQDNDLKRNFAIYNTTARPDVQFFPEGGKLVYGLRSKVGFKAVLANGKSVEVSGNIVDQNNQQIAALATVHAGMGVFALQPVAGSKYTAVIKTEAGAEYRYALPAADAEGYVLGVNHTVNDSITIRVAASQAFIQDKEIALVAQQNGAVRYVTKLKLNQPSISTRLDEKRFGTGLIQFTLLSAGGLPLAERLLFTNHHDQLKVSVSSNKASYAKREKVDMQFAVKDAEGKPIQGNFSIAVTDADQVKANEGEEITIISNLLLTSDLKGYIENPNYYFSDNTPDKVRQLDNLLLTQGWRRFTWADLKDSKLPSITFRAEKGLEVTGKVTTIMGSKPIANAKVTLFASTPTGPILADTVTNANGDFLINALDFAGDVRVLVKAANAKDKENVKIILNTPTHPAFDRFYQRGELNTTTILNYLSGTQKRFNVLNDGILNKTIMLKEVSVRERRIDTRKVVVGSQKMGVGAADVVIQKDALIRQTNLLSAFYGIAGIEVKGSSVYRVGRRTSISGPKQPMQVFINGSMVQPNMLADISPADVEGIEIIKSDYNLAVYGDQASSGVIEITLKKGGSAFAAMPIFNVGRLLVNGYANQREFYAPAYDKPAGSHKELDLRSTIYWNPNFVSDPEGKAKLSYFTADQPGIYRAVVEGIDIDGRLARQVYTFTVK